METTLVLALTHRYWPRANALARDLLLVTGGSLLVAALAQVRIPLSFTPVPFTGQTFAVLLVGAALGSRRGAAALAVYMLGGLAGFPVFTGGGSGLAHLAGPTGGYLVGFVAAAYAVGWLCELKLERRWSTALLPFLVGEALIYLFGVLWLAVFVGSQRALAAGLYPFLLGDIAKLLLAALALPMAWKYALPALGLQDPS
jgi:biotin transport system substrate-specific component